jgi:hypothetical protein
VGTIQYADTVNDAEALERRHGAVPALHGMTLSVSLMRSASHADGFTSPNGKVAHPTQGQAFLYFGDNKRLFAERFQEFGFLVEPMKIKSRPVFDDETGDV